MKSRDRNAEVEPSPHQQLQAKLEAIAAVSVDPGVGDGEKRRMHVVASLIAKGYDPEYVADVYDVTRTTMKRWESLPEYQDAFKRYRDLAHVSPEKAVDLARATAHDVMADVIHVSHTADDPNTRIAAAKVALGASRVTSDDKPKVEINFTKQEITMILEGLQRIDDERNKAIESAKE